MVIPLFGSEEQDDSIDTITGSNPKTTGVRHVPTTH